MPSPLVSIVTPVLNRADTVARCLRSVGAQTYPEIEHIVVDGGSTDGTLDVIASFQSQSRYSLRCISEPDNGMYDAINKGLSLASGVVLAYLNSDDLYLPWSVEAAVESISNDSPAVYGDLGVLTNRDGVPTFYPQFYVPFDVNYYTHFATLAQPTVFWLRSVQELIGGFDTSYKLLGDCDYWLRAAEAGVRFEHLDEILAIQHEHPGTLREVHPERLTSEFQRLRAAHSRHAGPARLASWQAARRRVRWRIYQARFIASASSRRSKRWPRFMSFLAERDIHVNRTGLLWYMLPEFLRPRRASLLDADRLELALAVP